MKKMSKLSSQLIASFAFVFIAVATVTSSAYCWVFWGETDCPACLRKH
ncbi:MAG: hypothetical protein CVV02_06155 [Firmicutes bacterium HGW-Firmicutes-7]|nr:MAG: hypothetical protein CVV02_06155 [Firmicutes bacterium HGW-Firmicutes-7]